MLSKGAAKERFKKKLSKGAEKERFKKMLSKGAAKERFRDALKGARQKSASDRTLDRKRFKDIDVRLQHRNKHIYGREK